MAAEDQLEALLDAVSALSAAAIDHAVIGGIAVGLRSGVPRATLDVDLAVPTTSATARVIEVLTAAGFEHRGSHRHSENFRHASGEPVQVALDPMFDPMIDRAEVVDVSGRSVKVVGTEDLVAMKERSAASPEQRKSKALRDLADVELLRGDVDDDDEGW